MTLASLGYVLNDALIRKATEEGLDVYQALCLRGVAMAAVFAVAGRVRGESLRRHHLQRPLLLRTVCEIMGTALFFGALVRIEFANAQAILQLIPFGVTLAAALLLGERVTTRHYVTILVGFVGVLIVIRPATEGFSAWSLLAVGSASFVIAREFFTRDVDAATPAVAIATLTAVASSMLMAVISSFSGWGDLTPAAVLYLAGSCTSLIAGYLFSIETVRVGDLSVSAPFRYTILLGAVVFGYLFFSEVPDQLTILGSVIIVATGLYAVMLERRSPAVRPAK